MTSASIETWTPELAKAALTNLHPSTRTVRQSYVDALVAAMKAGAWGVNGESVKFSASGKLMDGLSRLLAVVQSGSTVALVTVRDLPDDALDSIDVSPRCGKPWCGCSK